MTPRKLQALLAVHFDVVKKMNTPSKGKGKGGKQTPSAPVDGYIDQINW